MHASDKDQRIERRLARIAGLKNVSKLKPRALRKQSGHAFCSGLSRAQ